MTRSLFYCNIKRLEERNGNMKKFISVILAVALVFTASTSAFAAQDVNNTTEYDGLPVIIVRGIDFAGLTYADGSKALQLEFSTIFSLLMQSFVARMKVMSVNDLLSTVFDTAKGVLSPIACDKEGNSIEDVSMVQYHGSMAKHPDFVENLGNGGEEGIVKTAVERYGAENTYYFTYDWRKTPEQIATELDEFVQTAKKDSGKSRVNIICASMGGMVTTAYMHYFGTENINSAVYLSGAQNGTYVCGDALNGRIEFQPATIRELVESLTDNNIIYSAMLYLFDALGAFSYLTGTINRLVDNSFEEANDVVLRDCMGTLCGFWSLCPDDDFDSGIETIFGAHREEYPVLLEKLEGVREFVMSTEETLTNAKENGVKISFVSNYNIGLVPVYERANLNGDMVLETELTSNFATVAPLGKKLSNVQMATAESKYVSPDKVINATTALFRDNTWFVKDAPHVAADYGSGFSDFTFTLLESEVQPEVTMFKEYPQFMFADTMLNVYPLK